MATAVEVFYNDMGQRYEDAYANNPNLQAVVKQVMSVIPPKSTVLDAGCGTGKPVAHMIASAGHQVHGIDITETMVEIARNQVPGVFTQVDMRCYHPKTAFDAIFAVYSLFQMGPADVHAMIFRFANWLKDDGILVVGSVPVADAHLEAGHYNAVWDCVHCQGMPWMAGYTPPEVFFPREDWKKMLESAGLVIEKEMIYNFRPEDPAYSTLENHNLILARKARPDPLLGPHGPKAERCREHFGLDASAWASLRERVDTEHLDSALMDVLGGGQSLSITHGSESSFLSNRPESDHISLEEAFTGDNLPFPEHTVESAVGFWILDYADDITKTLLKMVQAVDRSAPTPRVVLLQGAPWNEVVRFQNAICAPLGVKHHGRSHQGDLLRQAMNVLSGNGFGHITMQDVRMVVKFPEENLHEKCQQAAALLAGLRYHDDPNLMEITQGLVPHLEKHFKEKPHEIGFDLVMLVAAPSTD